MQKRTKKIIKYTLIAVVIIALIKIIPLVKRYLIRTVDKQVMADNTKIEEEFEATENSYKSEELEITIEKKEEGEGADKVTYFIADIKLQNPERLKRAFANDQIGTNIVEKMPTMFERNNAILAINGDYYSFRNNGIIIGNGEIYREIPEREGLAMYRDGHMEIYDEKSTSAQDLLKKGVYNTLSFGPALVKSGIAQAVYTNYSVDQDNVIRGNIAEENPRTGIGYYDPNHYCFVVVDGRNEGYSKGVTLYGFAKIFEGLGCELAYNLDGGNSTNMYFMGKKVNKSSQPGDGEREISDIIFVK